MKSYPKPSHVKIELARRSFWDFCRIMAPEFYKDDRPHLRKLCDTLELCYRRELKAENLIIEMPPRHGKSRTLTNFSAWCLGQSMENRIITASFNDDLAQDFSRHTRDIITTERAKQDDIVFSDIFSGVKVKQGDASFKKWALDGCFFSYKGTGIGGSVTGRGGNILIVDDPVKDAETAYNPASLEKIWLWYTGTFLSRIEEGGIQIVCMTPWAKGDLSSRIIELEPERWTVLSMPAYDGKSMLCPDLLSLDRYKRLKKVGDEAIISANYDLQRMDIKGRLYESFQTYDEIPADTTGNVSYTDTADEGSDYLCTLHARKKGVYLYITDVVYTQESQETTETMVTQSIIDNQTKDAKIESNNGGRGFARNIQRMIDEKGYRCNVTWFHQSKNKQSRILTNSSNVRRTVFFPKDWAQRWPAFYNAVTTYQKEGKNKHDDAVDALTGLVEHFGENMARLRPSGASAAALGV